MALDTPEVTLVIGGGPLAGMEVTLRWAGAIVRDPMLGPGYVLGWHSNHDEPWKGPTWDLTYSDEIRRLQRGE